jgi:GT2 family glycosyltransferase
LSTTAPQTRHTVTAIIVAHDGARLLPGLVQALQSQTYPVEMAVGIDTGSRDRSGAVLAELIGADAVFGMDRSTGYGEAVAVALRHAARRRSGRTDPNLRRIEWIWLLHDDCEPAPDALERLIWAAGKDRSVVVLGPKVLDGQDRRTLREVGISIDRAGRRVTGIDPGEIDQGQHDHNKTVLAVGSAGMLVRRDVWDALGGFDAGLRLFRDDLDFCWRVQAAGYRVQVVTDAVVYHRELSARRRRPVEGGNVRRIDRTNALYVLTVNLPLLTMLRVVGGCVAGSLVRALYFLVTKQLDLASAHFFGVAGLFGHPVRLFRGRRRRAAARAEGYGAVRSFIPPARTLFRIAEKIAGLLSNGPPQASGGRHHASTDGSEEDEQFVEEQSVVRRVIGNPCVQLCTALVLIALIAERRLLGTSPLGGGALVPAWGGATALWHEYLAGFHAVGVGSTASDPPYVAVVAALSTLLGGQAWLAVDVLLLGCVPLAGLTAYLGTKWLVTATPARLLLAASYALLPVATGSIAAGRLGTAVVFILLPLIAVSAGRMGTAAPRQARRAAWATGLLIAVAAAFAPIVWVLGVLFAVGALGARRWLLSVNLLSAAIVVAVPFFVLFPWSLHLLASPSAFLTEAGVSVPGLTTNGLSPTALLALSPGGPGLPPVWVTAGFVLAVLATLLPARRAGVTIAGWCAAVTGLAAALVLSRVTLTPPGGGQAAAVWPGVAIALAALGLLVAAAPAAQWLTELIRNEPSRLPTAPLDAAATASRFRRFLACAALVLAATAPVLVATFWMKDGVQGPVGNVDAPVLPAFVAASSTSGEQYRTLILRPDGNGLDYMVVRQDDPTLGEPELTIGSAAAQALGREVAALGTPDGADAGDPGLELGQFGIEWVLLPAPVDSALAQRLDSAVGLVAQSQSPAYYLWRVAGPVARVRVVAADGTTTTLASGPVGMSGASAPVSGGTLELAEPYGGWTATLNGRALAPLPTPVDGWAQGFVLPPGGGTLSITRNNLARHLSLLLELIAALAALVAALPGKRADPAEEAEALAALREARHTKRAAVAARPARRPERSGRGRARRPGLAVPGLGAGGLGAAGLRAGRLRAGGFGMARRRNAGRAVATEDAAEFDNPLEPAEEAAVGFAGEDAAAVDFSADGFETERSAAAEPAAGDLPPWETGPLPPASWESGPQVAVSAVGAPGSAPWETGPQHRGAWGSGTRDSGAWDSGTRDSGTRDSGTRNSGAWDSDTRDSGAWDSGTRDSGAWDSGTRDSGAWDSGSRDSGITDSATWESGPQAPVSATGAQRAVPGRTGRTGRTGPQDGVTSTGSWRGRPGRSARTGSQDAVRSTGSWGSVPVPEVAPWESAEEDEAPYRQYADQPEYPEYPDPIESARPERHSHRGGRHGRPSRWRGSGGRSGGDGAS